MSGKFGNYRVNSINQSQPIRSKLLDEESYHQLLDSNGFRTDRSVVPVPLNQLNRYFGNLYELLPDCPPDHVMAEHHCRYWFKQISLAVEYLHSKGISHPNIVPRNIVYVYRERNPRHNWNKTPFDMVFKLGDFYMTSTNKDSIEVRKVNIYELGVTLTQTLIERHKFQQIICCLQRGMVPDFRTQKSFLNLSNEVLHLISGMISSDPILRPSIEEVLDSQWVLSQQTNPEPVRQSSVKIHVMPPDSITDGISYYVWPIAFFFILMYFIESID